MNTLDTMYDIVDFTFSFFPVRFLIANCHVLFMWKWYADWRAARNASPPDESLSE